MAGLPEAEKFTVFQTGTPIPLADTTLSDFQGSGAASAKGLVPDPGNSGTINRYLNEQGIWKAITPSDIVAFYSGSLPGYSLKLNVSVSASAAIINVLNVNGSVPTSTNPSLLIFKATAENDGGFNVLTVDTSLSLTIPSGATLGAIAADAFRIWLVAVNVSNSPALAVINCLSSTNIYPLKNITVYSSVSLTAMTTGSDSAQVFYASTSASGPATILGQFTYENGLVTPGEWSVAPTTVVLNKVGLPLPGDIVSKFGAQSSANTTGNLSIPYDNTTPQISEGTQFLSVTGQFSSKANLAKLTSQVMIGINTNSVANSTITIGLFQDIVASALFASDFINFGTAAPAPLGFVFWIRPNVARLTNTTLQLRAGLSTSASTVAYIMNAVVTVTTTSSAPLYVSPRYNGAMYSYLNVEEYMV